MRDDLDVASTLGRAELAFVELLGAVTSGRTAYALRYGQAFWADLDARPELRDSFDAKMSRRLQELAAQIAQRYPWHRFEHVVDVGGGDGTLVRSLLTAHPGLRATVVDLAPTAARAASAFAEDGLAERAAAVTGSFFDPLPAGADAYVLSDIVHNWDDEHAGAILDRCAQAAGAHGVVLVIELLRTGNAGGPANTGFDLSMLVHLGGRERTVAELADLAAGSGLCLQATHAVADRRIMLEFGRKPCTGRAPS